MNTLANHQAAATRPVIMLESSSQWNTWYSTLRSISMNLGVWERVNPANQGTITSQNSSQPAGTTPSSTATNTSSSDSNGSQASTNLTFELSISRNLGQLLIWIQSSVHPSIWEEVLIYEQVSEIITYLKKHFEPSQQTQMQQFREDYVRLTTSANKNQDIDQFQREFSSLVQRASRVEGFSSMTSEEWAFEFVKPLYSINQNLYLLLAPHVSGSNRVTFAEILDLVKLHLKVIKLGRAQRQAPYSASFATIGNRGSNTERSSGQQQPKSKCPIDGGFHWLSQCYYLNPSTRPPNWHPKPAIQRRHEENIKDQPDYRDKVERALQRIANSGQGPANSSQEASQTTSSTTSPAPISCAAISCTAISLAQSFGSHPTKQFDQSSWILDTGSNVHVCNDLSLFINFTTVHNERLATGNGDANIDGKGTVLIECLGGDGSWRSLELKDCLYAPHVPLNLLSGTKIVGSGGSYSPKLDWIHWPGYEKFINLQLIHGLPHAKIRRSQSPSTFMVSSHRIPHQIDELAVWHSRLGHAGHEAIKRLPEAAIGVNLPIESPNSRDQPPNPPSPCETCAESKLSAQISRVPATPGDHAFQKVSIDLIEFNSGYNGDRYAIHLVDSYTNFHLLWTIPDKEQHTLMPCIENMHRLTVMWGYPIQIMRLDNEAALKDTFYRFTATSGIRLHFAPPYTPDQNGDAESSGKYLVVVARSLRVETGLPDFLWPELIKTAVFIANRTPNRRLGWKTPFEYLTRHKPVLAYLRRIGSLAYVLNKTIDRKDKLLQRADIGYLIGYDAYNIYRVWVPSLNRVIRSRDVLIDETKVYKHHHREISIEQKEEISQAVTLIELPEIVIPDYWEFSADTPIPTNPTPVSRSPANQEDNQEQEKEIDDPSTSLPTPPATAPANSPGPESDEVNTEEESSQSEPRPTPPIDQEQPIDQTQPPARRNRDRTEGLDATNIIRSSGPYSIRSRTRPQANFAAIDDSKEKPGESLELLYHCFLSAINEGLNSHQPRSEIEESLPPPPQSYKAARKHRFANEWMKAMLKELETLKFMGTYEVINRPENTKLLPLKWVFSYKLDTNGCITKYKARLVARGDLQAPTNDDVYASTLAYRTLRILLAIIAYFNWETLQLDAINAFLNSLIRGQIFTELPPGFSNEGHCWKLLKALYGLRISPLLWFEDLSTRFIKLGFKQIADDRCLFVHHELPIMAFFYVDDIILACDKRYIDAMHRIKLSLMDQFKLRELGEMKHFLNLQILRDRPSRRLWLTQSSYIHNILNKYKAAQLRVTRSPLPTTPYTKYEGVANDEDIEWYQSRVGSLLYAAVVTRPDIARSCSHLCEFLKNPGPDHIQGVEHLFGYLKGTPNYAIEYSGEPISMENITYSVSDPDELAKRAVRVSSDAAFGDCPTTRQSTQGHLITLFNGPIAWLSSKQRTVTTSTTEAELLALSNTAKELLALQRFFASISFEPEQEIVIECDNQQTIGLLTKDSPQLQTKLKHVDIHHFWLRQEVRTKKIRLQWTPSADTLADGLTKVLPPQRHQEFVKLLNLQDITSRLRN
jgi:hypothetical protein